MTLSINWTGADPNPPYKARITVPQAYLTFVTGSLYELDTDAFWDDLKSREDDEDGIVFGDLQIRFSSYTVAGVTFAPALLMQAEVVFEDTGSAYSVRLAGTNNDIFDVENGILIPTDKVTIIAQNSAGLVEVGTSGLTATESQQLNDVYDGVFGQKILRVSTNPATLPGYMLLYDDAVTPVIIGHKELWADEAMTVGWSDTGTIYFEGRLVAGNPP